MSAIERLLDGFSEHELAWFKRCKLPTYLPATQERILAYLKSNGLPDDIEHWTQHRIHDGPGGCIRCGSLKIQRQETEKWNTSRHEALGSLGTGAHLSGFREECMVCGQLLQDPNEASSMTAEAAPGLLEAILAFFRR